MHRWPSVTDESVGEVTLTIRSSWACRVTAQPTPQYGQIVSVCGLGGLVPRAGLAHVVLGLEHQRAGRAHADAVAAVDARRLGQRDGLLGRDPGVEATPGHRDRKGVLGLLATRVDALVAEDALRVVADVQLVVDLGRLGHRRGRRVAGRGVVMARLERVALAGRRGRGGRAVAGRVGSVALGVGGDRPVGRDRARPATGRPTSRGTRGPSCATVRTRSESVWIAIPGSTTREQAGTRTREPASSTTHTRQTLTGVRFSA